MSSSLWKPIDVDYLARIPKNCFQDFVDWQNHQAFSGVDVPGETGCLTPAWSEVFCDKAMSCLRFWNGRKIRPRKSQTLRWSFYAIMFVVNCEQISNRLVDSFRITNYLFKIETYICLVMYLWLPGSRASWTSQHHIVDSVDCLGFSDFNWATKTFGVICVCTTKTKFKKPFFVIEINGAESLYCLSILFLVGVMFFSAINNAWWAHEIHILPFPPKFKRYYLRNNWHNLVS